jgi:hypothetical protein
MSNKTAEGLRDRLFDTLDALIDKKIGKSEVESVCYISEQILKTAQIEIEIARESQKAIESERQYQLQLKREAKDAQLMLSRTIESLNEIKDVA